MFVVPNVLTFVHILCIYVMFFLILQLQITVRHIRHACNNSLTLVVAYDPRGKQSTDKVNGTKIQTNSVAQVSLSISD